MTVQDDEEADSVFEATQKGLSDGIVIANRILVVCLCLGLPVLIGGWVGGKLGSQLGGMLVGLFVGMAVAGVQLMSLVKWLATREKAKQAERKNSKSMKAKPATESEVDPWEKRWEDKWDGDPDKWQDSGQNEN